MAATGSPLLGSGCGFEFRHKTLAEALSSLG